MWEERLALFDKLIATNTKFKRKGKTMPYASANGYMFALLNKAGEIGLRFSKEDQQQFLEKHQTTLYKSYGAVMKGYVRIPDEMFEDMNQMAKYLDDSYEYVMTLPPK